MNKFESGFGQNDKLPLYERKNLVDWKLVNKKVGDILNKEEEQETNNNPEDVLTYADRAWKPLDEKANSVTANDIKNTEKLIQEIETKFPEIKMFAAEQYC